MRNISTFFCFSQPHLLFNSHFKLVMNYGDDDRRYNSSMFKLCPRLAYQSLHLLNKYWCYSPHLMTIHQAQLTIRATRRLFLNKSVLNQNKDVIYAELRQPQDLVLKLKQQGKCPGVILPHSKIKAEEIDIVLEGKAMKARMKKKQYGLHRVAVRVAGQQHLCVLREVRMHPQEFIQKVYLQQYVVGQPNHLVVPLTFTHLQQNRFFHEGYKMVSDLDEVSIICYNEEYPTGFHIDVSYVNQDRPYTIGDLANTFPPGIILHPNEDPSKIFFKFGEKEAELTGDALNEALGLLAESNKQKAKAASGTPAAGGAATGAKATDAKQPAAAAKQPAAPAGDAGKKKK